MTLRDRRFERSVRRRVRQGIRQSPALRKEQRRIRQTRQTDFSQAVVRGFITFTFLMSLAKLGTSGATLDALLGLLVIWCASFTLHYANRLRFQLYGAPQLLVLALQPMRDDAIFGHQWRGFTRLSLWILADAAGALTVIFWFAQANPVQWITALPCALAIWMSAVSVAALFVRLRPAANFGGLSSGCFLLVVTAVIAGFYLPEPVARLLDGASGPFFLVPPFGWITYVIREAVLGSALLPLVLLLPVAFLAPGLHHARKRLAAHYQLFASDGPEPADLNEADAPPALPGSGVQPPAGAADPEHVRFITETWEAPTSPWPQGGFLERWIAHWLTPRERNIAEFITAGTADWTLSLRRASILMMAAVLAATTLGPTGLWVCYIGLYFAASTAVPVLGSSCVGLSIVQLAGTSFPAYAGLPLGYREMGRVLLKVGMLRTLAFTPVALVAGTAIGHLAGTSWTFGLLTATKVVALLLCWQPTAVTLQFSAGTNDTRSSTGRSLKIFGALAPLILALAGTGAGALFAPAIWALACLPAAALLSWAAFRLYGRFYNRNAFDLMHGQPQ